MYLRLPPLILLLALVPGPTTAQAADPPSGQHLGTALLEFVAEYERGELQLRGPVLLSKSSPDLYARSAALGGVELKDDARTLHLTLLHKLIAEAERQPSLEVADGLLAVASIGFAGDMYGHEGMMLRDLGHFAILRCRDNRVWGRLLTLADGSAPAEAEAEQGEEEDEVVRTAAAMRRVAAIRLLGARGDAVFRPVIRACLRDEDGRIRLAAAEALGAMRHPDSLAGVARAVATEHHPMVVLALLHAMGRILRKHGAAIEVAAIASAMRTAVTRFGTGWRNDIALVELCREFPVKEAIPRLIERMRAAEGTVDPILKIINRGASKRLGHEAHLTLRHITGALVPEDAAQWQEFWEREKDRLVVVPRRDVPPTATVATSKGATFYGIPVLGSHVAFVIDTSGSMKAKVGPSTGPSGERTRGGTRLTAAKQQTLAAVQGMDSGCDYRLVTFSGGVQAWTKDAVRPSRSSHGLLTRVLGRLEPKGGTNLFGALMEVLGGEAGYGTVPGSDVDEIFLLTDGMPSVGELTATEDILQVVREINRYRKVRIHTVFTGTGSGTDFLRDLAEQNGGVFVQR